MGVVDDRAPGHILFNCQKLKERVFIHTAAQDTARERIRNRQADRGDPDCWKGTISSGCQNASLGCESLFGHNLGGAVRFRHVWLGRGNSNGAVLVFALLLVPGVAVMTFGVAPTIMISVLLVENAGIFPGMLVTRAKEKGDYN